MASSYCSVVLGDVLVKRARMLTAILSLAWGRADPNREAITEEKSPGAVAISLRRVAAPILCGRHESSVAGDRARRVARSRQAQDAYVVLRARPPGSALSAPGAVSRWGGRGGRASARGRRVRDDPVDATPDFRKVRAVRCIPTTAAPRAPGAQPDGSP